MIVVHHVLGVGVKKADPSVQLQLRGVSSLPVMKTLLRKGQHLHLWHRELMRHLCKRRTLRFLLFRDLILCYSDAQVTLPHSSSNTSVRPNLARTPQPKSAKSFFGTLTNKLRVRTPASRRTHDCILDEPERAEVQSSLHTRTFRPQAVPITLPNDIASRERRADALRARGLLPPRSRALSAIEAEEDRRIDALQVNSLSVPGPDRNITMHNNASILAQLSLIDDDETRRLTELAFM
ncbi:hypothetical protein EDB83DRAFT_520812 [Lactarius deliciosus]|nr:hypothetical protein EDB83DRAFT_520812 [Lactarius deliciosus]